MSARSAKDPQMCFLLHLRRNFIAYLALLIPQSGEIPPRSFANPSVFSV